MIIWFFQVLGFYLRLLLKTSLLIFPRPFVLLETCPWLLTSVKDCLLIFVYDSWLCYFMHEWFGCLIMLFAIHVCGVYDMDMEVVRIFFPRFLWFEGVSLKFLFDGAGWSVFFNILSCFSLHWRLFLSSKIFNLEFLVHTGLIDTLIVIVIVHCFNFKGFFHKLKLWAGWNNECLLLSFEVCSHILSYIFWFWGCFDFSNCYILIFLGSPSGFYVDMIISS